MLQAFRDTWELGIHSYLTYLRDRLLLARELLHESGSIFVQISNENVHRLRTTLDEVLGPSNYCGEIVFRKTTGKGSQLLDNTYDTIVWYAKDLRVVKYHALYEPERSDDQNLRHVELRDGTRRKITDQEVYGLEPLPSGATPVSAKPTYKPTTGSRQ